MFFFLSFFLLHLSAHGIKNTEVCVRGRHHCGAFVSLRYLLPVWKKMGGNVPRKRGTNRRLRLGETRNNRVRIRHPLPLPRPARAPGSVTQQLFLLRGVTITFMQSTTLQTPDPHQQQLPAATADQSGSPPAGLGCGTRPEALAFRLVRCDLFFDADALGGPRNRRLRGQYCLGGRVRCPRHSGGQYRLPRSPPRLHLA